jgi:oligopeptide/dipeptide ABC transporter ATP-binding protein
MTLLEVLDLRVELPHEGSYRPVVAGVSLHVAAGDALGLVGESGCGKSMTARAVAGILPRGSRVTGSIAFAGTDLATAGRDERRRITGTEIGVVFQDPRAHINPVRRIDDFATEGLRLWRGMSRRAALELVEATLEQMGVRDPRRVVGQYPHQLSGGLLQRVMIAAALVLEPRLLIADEPTTALDATTQSDVMAILDEQRRGRGLALLFITHDVELAASVCDRTAVMYAGSIMEEGASAALDRHPRHPYTAGLLGARPSIEARVERLVAIKGRPVSALEAPPGCPFGERCPFVEESCRTHRPELRPFQQGLVACVRAEALQTTLAEVAR